MVESSANGGAATGAQAAAGGGWVQGFTPLPTGARVGELTIQSVLGAGEFGITYVTEHEKRVKRYVLKEYFPRRIAYRDGPMVRAQAANAAVFAWGLDRFLAEARAVMRLRHPSIVSIHGVTEAGGTGFAGMAYEAGRDWSIWLHELRRLPTQEELDNLLGPLLQALELAHANDVIHQDLGPESIVVRDSGSPVLVDFGAFRAGLRHRLGITEAPRHASMAPEQIETGGEHAGPWTDIYALAALIHVAVSGKSPPTATERTSGKELVPAADITTGRYRADFLKAIDAGLRIRPVERPQSVAEWRGQLLQTRTSRLTSPKAQQPAATTAPTAPAERKAADRTAAPAVPPDRPREASAPVPPQQTAPSAPANAEEHIVRPFATSDPADAEKDAAPKASSPHYELPLQTGNRPETRTGIVGFWWVVFALVGFVGGAVVGALVSGPIATLVGPQCDGATCFRSILPALCAAGALAGVWIGTRLARNEKPPVY